MKSVNLSNLQLYKNKISEHINKIVEDNFCDESSIDNLFRNEQIITFDGYGTGRRGYSNIRLYDSDGNLYKMSKTAPIYNESETLNQFVLTRNINDMKTISELPFDVLPKGNKEDFENYVCKDGELKIKISSRYRYFVHMFTAGLSETYGSGNCGAIFNRPEDFISTLTLTGEPIITKFGFNNFGPSRESNMYFKSIKLTNTVNGVLKGTIEQPVSPHVSYTLDI